ncbi:hypothetical protein E3P99_02904 [Wallemia hederae]|uniref:NADH-ubiquinone oxidoreductase n=1 Tax=Wallemia hederae TaxID=1540922 RepID=A0A4T0FJP5_9BASI|nr:hypothetical protein E3P99_02904 [Wallemia hederae]
MADHRDAVLNAKEYVETSPMPKDVPHVDELGATSAPLKSASFFIGDKCREYNDDFMLCKQQNADPAHCLKEGRKVTRCASSVINDINKHCFNQFKSHFECLEFNNQYFYPCRKQERSLNECVAASLNLHKNIPGSPADQPQIHEKPNPIHKRIQH